MPPKKKKKDDKARERQRREEAERRAREEEEQRILEEQARLEEEARLAAEREERKRLREEERIRFLGITGRLNQELAIKIFDLDCWKIEHLKEIQWDNYTSCSEFPDPSEERAVNTYLTLCEENTSCPQINDALIDIDNWLQICDRIEQVIKGDGVPDPSPVDSYRLQEVLSKFKNLILKKLDLTTLFYMAEAEKYVDPNTYNLTVEASLDERVTFCLWGNVVKDPRLKSFSFDKKLHFTLDLPKPLLLADVAIRAMQLDFDPLSPQSQSYNCTHTSISPIMSTLSGSVAVDGGETPGEQVTDEEVMGSVGEGVKDEKGSTQGQGAGEGRDNDSGEAGVAGVGDVGGVGDGDGDGGDGDGVEGGGTEEDGEEAVTSTVAAEGEVNQEVRDHMPSAPATMTPGSAKKIVLEEDEVDLRSFQPARGPIILEIFEMPTQPKSVGNWTIRRELPQTLFTYSYPAKQPVRQPSSTSVEDIVTPSGHIQGSSLWPAISISLKLPEEYIFSEEPQMASWDEKEKIWRTKDIQNAKFDMDEKTVSFQMFHFRPFAIMVDQYTNMPYVTWELLPMGQNHTLLTIEGGVSCITIQIKKNECVLVGPEDQPALSHLLNQPMTTRKLMNSLTKVGANFFPEPDASRYVSITKKHHRVEGEVYRSMALCSCGFGFRWSRWNSETSTGTVVVSVAERDCGKEVNVEKLTWRNYLCGKRSFRLVITDDDDDFSLDKPEGCLAYPGLYSALEEDSSQSVREVIRETSPVHTDAVQQWLNSTKVLTLA